MDGDLIKINPIYWCIKNILKWNQHVLKLWLCANEEYNNYTTNSCHCFDLPEGTALLHIIAFAASVQMSTQWNRKMMSYYYENSLELTLQNVSGTPRGPQIDHQVFCLLWVCSLKFFLFLFVFFGLYIVGCLSRKYCKMFVGGISFAKFISLLCLCLFDGCSFTSNFIINSKS